MPADGDACKTEGARFDFSWMRVERGWPEDSESAKNRVAQDVDFIGGRLSMTVSVKDSRTGPSTMNATLEREEVESIRLVNPAPTRMPFGEVYCVEVRSKRSDAFANRFGERLGRQRFGLLYFFERRSADACVQALDQWRKMEGRWSPSTR